MKIYFVILAIFSITFATAEALTEEEKAAMLEKVEALKKKVVDNNHSYQKNAISDFRSAMNSEQQAYKLYQACQEKIALEKLKRKGKDVRATLKNDKQKVSSEFKHALRHQLYWLVYSLEASRNQDARMDAANKLVNCMANIIDDADSLNKKTTLGGNPLKQNPFESVFARAYKVDHLKPKEWPSNPLDFNGLYEGLIMKDLLERGMFSDARQQWISRLNAERSLIEAYADEPDSTEFGEESVALDTYLNITGPSLQWHGEQILHKAGDKKNSYIEMYKMLEKHPNHPNYLEWVQWIQDSLGELEEE